MASAYPSPGAAPCIECLCMVLLSHSLDLRNGRREKVWGRGSGEGKTGSFVIMHRSQNLTGLKIKKIILQQYTQCYIMNFMIAQLIYCTFKSFYMKHTAVPGQKQQRTERRGKRESVIHKLQR